MSDCISKPAFRKWIETSLAPIDDLPELEAACRTLMEGVQLGGPYLPQGYRRLRLQFPGNHGGVNWGGTAFNPQLGYLFVNTNELGQLAGLTDRDPTWGVTAGFTWVFRAFQLQ